MTHRSAAVAALLVLAAGMPPWGPAASRAADQPESRVAVAKNVGLDATLLRRSGPGSPWMPVRADKELYSGDLILGGLAGAIQTLNGDVGLTIKGDLADRGPFPVLETALVLHPPKDVDLDFTLERGRVAVTNLKKSGPAKVRVHSRDKAAEFTLKEPGAAFALEVYGRWPAGVPFKKDARPEDGPPLALVLLVLKGEVVVKGPKREATMKEPPGLGMFLTDDLDAASLEPLFIDKLPSWAAGGPPSPQTVKAMQIGARLREALLNKPLDEVLDEAVRSDDPLERRIAVLMMGATDSLEKLGDALTNAKHPDVWDAAVVALRHWIGRAPGQDMRLYTALIAKRGFTPVQAEAVLSLLHSFGDEDLNTPETYETLIDYLQSDKLGLRGLAYWHLIRLVPQGQKLGYEPTDPKDKRDAAVKRWRELIPVGKLPPKPKPEDFPPEPKDK